MTSPRFSDEPIIPLSDYERGIVDNLDLRESVELESQSDLMAAVCNFGEASRLMKEANLIRRRVFGRGLDPNELRALTHTKLGGKTMTSLEELARSLTKQECELLLGECEGWGSWMFEAGEHLCSLGLGTKRDGSIAFNTPLADRVRNRLYLDRAKELLSEKLASHPDEGVRAINGLVELTDDNPAVIRIAACLRSRAAIGEGL